MNHSDDSHNIKVFIKLIDTFVDVIVRPGQFLKRLVLAHAKTSAEVPHQLEAAVLENILVEYPLQ